MSSNSSVKKRNRHKDLMHIFNIPQTTEIKHMKKEDYEKTVYYLLDRIKKLVDEVHTLSHTVDTIMDEHTQIKERYL